MFATSKREKRRQRPMRVVAWTILALLAGHLALSVWVASIPWYNDVPFVERFGAFKARYQQRAAQAPKLIVMVGSSRTQHIFAGDVAEANLAESGSFVVHNFGMVGGGSVMQFLVTTRLIEAGVRPDLLLLEVSPCFLNGATGTLPERCWLDPTRLRREEEIALEPFGWEPRPTTLLDRVTARWFACRTSTVRLTRSCWMPQDNISGVPVDAWGHFSPIEQPEKRTACLDGGRKTFRPMLEGWTAAGPPVAVLERLITLCREKGIPTLLVGMPEGPEARSWYTAEAIDRVKEFYRRWPREVDRPFVDAWRWLDEGDFHDSHHVTKNGAKKFTARLTREVLIPWFRGTDGGPRGDPFVTTSFPRPGSTSK